MRQISSNLKKGEIKLEAENNDDLWFLNQIIEPKDLVSGKTVRKIKTGGEEERSSNVVKKVIFATIEVEKVDFCTDSLRLSGKIVDGPDDIPRGVYHTIVVEPQSRVLITKKHWYSYQLDKLEEACKQKPTNILICLMDREEAYFAKLKTKGFELLSHIEGDVPKKESEQKVQKEFYSELLRMLSDYEQRFNCSSIIIASPSFWKEELLAKVQDKILRQKIILATSSSVTLSGLNEVLRRPEVLSALKEERISQEIRVVEELLMEISKNGLAAYGFKEVKLAAEASAIGVLLVADSYLKQARENDSMSELETVMRRVEQNKGKVKLISVEHEAGRELKGLGGIAALLRYRIS
jgi:protein pelota